MICKYCERLDDLKLQDIISKQSIINIKKHLNGLRNNVDNNKDTQDMIENIENFLICCKEPIWESNVKSYYYNYINSRRWKIRRLQAIKKANYKCESCGKKCKLEVHHKTYDNLGNEPDEDLEALCRECHIKHHNPNPEKQAKY
jgi:5-methylcytosine-specific restriction endonuclease McrA